MASMLLDLVLMTPSSAFGTSSTIPLGAAATVSGVNYLTFASAGATSSAQISYSLLDTVNGGSEIGIATYTSSNTTLTGRTPTKSTNGSTFINASSGTLITGTARAEDIVVGVSSGVMQTLTNATSADVNLTNTATYFDGPSVALSSIGGTWFVTGSVTCTDTTAAIAAFVGRLWDGTTIFSGGGAGINNAGNYTNLTISAIITSPSSNVRISVRDLNATTGKILYNVSGSSRDSSITAVRIG